MKQDAGGIADIEFLAQYWVLTNAGTHPPLVRYADTIRQLESVGSAALVEHEVIDRLVSIYRDYRAVIHHASLEGGGRIVKDSDFVSLRAEVTAIWERAFGGGNASV